MIETLSECDISFDELRAREFPLLDERGLAYLDYTGAALPPRSLLDAHDALHATTIFGNPHADHAPSRASTDAIEEARLSVLRFVDADPADYDVCFTANATGAIKLVAESFPFHRGGQLAIAADNHNSVNGIREYARRGGAEVRTIGLTPALRLEEPVERLGRPFGRRPRLLAFPAQSNFSGVQHPLSLIAEAQRLGYAVLLDAAAFVPSSPLSLRAVRPEFVALSFYKVFGVPTGVGALVARRDVVRLLRRPWFSGGSVDWVSVQHGRHRLRPGLPSFEDGTPNYLGIAALAPGFAFMRAAGAGRIHSHVQANARALENALGTSRHGNGRPMVEVYGAAPPTDRGGTIAFNVRDPSGRLIPCEEVGTFASNANIAVRCGCFCNPGAAEAAFRFAANSSLGCLEAASLGGFTVRRFAACLGGETAVGAVRASVGMATNAADVRRLVDVVREIAAGRNSCSADVAARRGGGSARVTSNHTGTADVDGSPT